MKKRVAFQVLLALFALFFLALVYLGSVFIRSSALYVHIKKSERGFIGYLHQYDPVLGYAPVPGSYGSEALPIGPPVATHYDDDGFRAPLLLKRSFNGGGHPRILFLGCSFTYGAVVSAEDTFAYRAARDLGGAAINAGVSGYGLAQMVLRARLLIPKYKPDYVVVQYSPWLVDRAVSEFAPVYFGLVPVPYYSGNDSPVLEKPVFRTLVADLPYDGYRNTPQSLADRLSFMWRVSLPLYLHDDANYLVFRLKRMTGIFNPPSRNAEAVVRSAYSEISGLADSNGSRMIIMVLGNNQQMIIPDDLFPRKVVEVDGQQALLDRLETASSESYARSYWHWRGNPLVAVDGHPNQKAHAILADELVRKIRLMQAGPPASGGPLNRVSP